MTDKQIKYLFFIFVIFSVIIFLLVQLELSEMKRDIYKKQIGAKEERESILIQEAEKEIIEFNQMVENLSDGG